MSLKCTSTVIWENTGELEWWYFGFLHHVEW